MPDIRKKVSIIETVLPSYYAIIPAAVRYDRRIPANGKLLFGEVSALIGEEGFCFATNQYFARVYGLSPDSVSRLLGKLEKTGYIRRQLEKGPTGQVLRRKIFLSEDLPRLPGGRRTDPSPRKRREGTGRSAKDTITSNTVETVERSEEEWL